MNAADEKLKKLILNVTSIPTLPEVVIRVNSLLSDPNTRAMDIAHIISEDPSLTITLLKVVNSPFYGLPRKIVQIDHAIAILGFNATHSLLMTTSVLNSFASKKKDIEGFSFSKFWTHSLGVATASRLLAPYFGLRSQAEDLYVAGLLHDMGRMIIQQNDPDSFQKVIKTVRKENLRIQDAEKAVLGFSHEDVGSLLASRWNLPSKLVTVIASHHNPLQMESYREFAKLSSIVHLADILCKMIDLGHSGDEKIPVVRLDSWDLLECRFEILDTVLQQLRQQRQSIESLSLEAGR